MATKQDAADVIEIMKFSIIDVFSDECGILDKTRSQNGTGTSSRGQVISQWKRLIILYMFEFLGCEIT